MSIAGVFGLLVFLIMVVVPLVGGVLLIVFSRRRRPDHPACGKCGYNVHATIGSGTRCPECGADFAQAGITPPRGKRNPFMIAAGVVLIVLAVGCLGSSLLLPIAKSQAARNAAAQKPAAAQKAPARADAAQPETEEDPEAD